MKSMKVRWLVVAALAVLSVTPAHGQGQFEVSAYGGGSASSGMDLGFLVTDPTTNVVYDGIGFKSGAAFGATVGYYFNPAMEIELGFIRQNSVFQGMRVNGGEDDFQDVTIDQIQAHFIYNMYDDSKKVRPFVGLGLGATIFTSEDFRGNSIESQSFFAPTLSAGIKAKLRGALGLRLQARVTPTYIKSTTEGYWCGWGACWPVEEAHFITQVGLTAGLNLRFGKGEE